MVIISSSQRASKSSNKCLADCRHVARCKIPTSPNIAYKFVNIISLTRKVVCSLRLVWLHMIFMLFQIYVLHTHRNCITNFFNGHLAQREINLSKNHKSFPALLVTNFCIFFWFFSLSSFSLSFRAISSYFTTLHSQTNVKKSARQDAKERRNKRKVKKGSYCISICAFASCRDFLCSPHWNTNDFYY